MRIVRLIAATVVVVALPVAAVGWARVQRDRLPAELATHWSGGDRPDGFTTRDTFYAGIGVAAAVVVVLAVAWVLAWRGSARARTRRIGLTILAGLSGTVTGLTVLVVVPNLGLADPAAARIGPESAVLLPLMLGLAALAWWMHGAPATDGTDTGHRPDPALPRAATGVTEHVEAHTPWRVSAAVFVLMAATGVVVAAVGLPWVGGELMVLAVAVAWLTQCTIRARASDGLTLRGGPIGVRIPVQEFAGAVVVERIDPFGEFGGWGLRVVPGATALVTRRGPGVELSRGDGRRVVMTSDEPEQLAGVLNTLADQRFT